LKTDVGKRTLSSPPASLTSTKVWSKPVQSGTADLDSISSQCVSSPTPLSESVYRLQSAVYTYVLVVLVLILIKDALTIKRMLTTWHSFTRDLFIYQSCKSRYRKCMLSSPPALLLPRYGRNRIRAARRTKTQLKRVIQANVCLARRSCQNQFIADSQQ